MEKFLNAFNWYKEMEGLGIGYYRLCWVWLDEREGYWTVFEFFDWELPKIDPNKVEVVAP